MTVNNYAKNRVALFLAGSDTTYPDYFIIGTGSSTVTASDTELETASDRQAITSATLPEQQKITWQGDWSSVEMSGTTLTEFGIISSGTALTGSIWSRTVIPALIFDGSNELRIEETWEVY